MTRVGTRRGNKMMNRLRNMSKRTFRHRLKILLKLQRNRNWEGPDTIYKMLKKKFKRIPVTFHVGRLQREFEKIHNEVNQKK